MAESERTQVLLVEADIDRAEALAQILGLKAQCNVTAAASAVDGIRLLRKGGFSLGLINTSLEQKEDGVKLVILLATKAVERPPIVMMSTAPDPNTVRTCSQAGVAGFLAVRGDLTEVVNRVRAILEQAGRLDERLVKVVAVHTGPAARIFLQRGLDSGAGGLKLSDIAPRHLPWLFNWIATEAEPLIPGGASALLAQLESEFGEIAS